MKISLNKNNLNKIKNINIDNLIIGSFDGIHKGHYKLLNKKGNLVVLIIHNIPHKNKYIYNLTEKIENIKIALKPKHILVFNLKKENCTAFEFIDMYLNNINTKQITIGSDFIFGNDGQNINYLKEYLNNNIKLMIIKRTSNSYSTTKIKCLLQTGKIIDVNNKLLIPYSITSKVIKGNQIASKILNCPTANIKIDKNKIILKSGIYITNTILENHQYNSITFIGKSKSFKNTKYSVETHLLNYCGDNFYNKKIKVIFIKKIGNVKKYKNINKLKDDINNYILKAKYFFNIERFR